jgi:hypothetical protein
MVGLAVSVWLVLVLLSFDRTSRLAALCAGAPLVALGAWVVSGPWLEADALVVKELWRERRLPLREIGSVTTRWVPYKGQDLVLIGRGRSLSLVCLTEDTQPLRFELGRRLQANGPSVLEDRRG